MNVILIVVAMTILACVLSGNLSRRLGMPVLLLFILIGMLMGSDGLFKIPFDNYPLAEKVCSVALIFIMFYGGFSTKWSVAKPVAMKALILSSLGTILTAGLVGLLCNVILKIELLESFLIGAVISSTDAASVFSILRFKRLNLKDNTASLLEIESGSNDPFSYMLTVIVLSLMNGSTSTNDFAWLVFSQLVFGVLLGCLIAVLTIQFLKRVELDLSGFGAVFMIAVATLAYAIPSAIGGNGYLSVYITGIILGNHKMKNKQELVHFFDGATGLMQMLLFFLLGLLSFPSRLPQVALPALCIALFLTFIARPVAVFAILTPYKSSFKQSFLVSWVGLRGAASIVFSIMAVIDPATINNDVFHIVFFIVLYSILLQGTLLPFVARKLDMIDSKFNVLYTFNDYLDETPLQCIYFTVPTKHSWIGKTIESLTLPPETLLVLLIRGKEKIVPTGQIEVRAGDTLVLSGKALYQAEALVLLEKHIEIGSNWENKTLAEIAMSDELVIMIKRQDDILMPKGSTMLKVDDVLVIIERAALN